MIAIANESKAEVTYKLPDVTIPLDITLPMTTGQIVWRSCCFRMDKQFIHFLVQTCIGVGLLVFCAIELTVEKDCERSAPYWGLMGTICGFFFRSITTNAAR